MVSSILLKMFASECMKNILLLLVLSNFRIRLTLDSLLSEPCSFTFPVLRIVDGNSANSAVRYGLWVVGEVLSYNVNYRNGHKTMRLFLHA